MEQKCDTVQRATDLQMVLSKVTLGALLRTWHGLKKGQVRGGNFGSCLMRWLSWNRGQFGVSSRYSLPTWAAELTSKEGNLVEMEAAIRRLIRAYDEGTGAHIVLCPGNSYEEYYCNSYPFAYTLTNEDARKAIGAEIARRFRAFPQQAPDQVCTPVEEPEAVSRKSAEVSDVLTS